MTPSALPPAARRHAWRNALQSMLLLAFIAVFLTLLGWMLWGPAGLGLLVGLFVLPFVSGMSSAQAMARFGAVPIPPERAPELWSMLDELSARAGLPRRPVLYYLPSPAANAFTVGGRGAAAVALTDGLLRRLAPRELAGVLAHEIGHIHSGDLRVMAIADLMSRAIALCAQIGVLLALFSLPLMLFGHVALNPLALGLLIFAPYPAALAQLALSRTREYDADRFAVGLTGDPEGLASALAKLDEGRQGWLARILLPGYRREPALLRSHPSSARRIARLAEYRPVPARSTPWRHGEAGFAAGAGHGRGAMSPRRWGAFRW